MDTISFKQAIQEVGEWSQRNFGDQKGAGALAPLAGIDEEYGEAYEAMTEEEYVDGYVDQLVYLADVCGRAGLDIDPEWNVPGEMVDRAVAKGRLAKALLKRHQGIRGFDKDEKFLPYAQEAARQLFEAIQEEFYEDELIRHSDIDLAEEFTKTWRRVSKRDWVQNPTNAAEVAG